MILRNSRRRKTNLHVTWIDYKKAFDSLPHIWIAKCLEIVGVSGNIRRFLSVAMASWQTVLTGKYLTTSTSEEGYSKEIY